MPTKILHKLTLLVLLAISLPACTTATKNFQAGEIPAYQPVSKEVVVENKFKLTEIMDSQNLELSQEGPEYERVKRIIDRLSRNANIEQSLDVYTSEAGERVNAFALGGNTIVCLLYTSPSPRDS